MGSIVRIGVDARPLSRPAAGISRAVRNILAELQRLDCVNEYFLYSDRDFEFRCINSRWQKKVDASKGLLPGSLWLQMQARTMASEDDIDVFWGTAHALPLRLPAKVRKVLTVNDVVWAVFPESMSLYNRFVHHLLVAGSIRRADAISVPSESTLDGLQGFLRDSTKDIRVVYYGVESHYVPHDHAGAARYIASKYCIATDYICTVGTVEPRKNLERLIQAWHILRTRHGCMAELLVAGAQGWKTSSIQRQLSGLGQAHHGIRFLGYVPEDDMPLLYSGASAFVFPSLYEGFGLPLLEAMACGAPVVASNSSSIPEVVGGAGILVDPLKPEEFAKAIIRVRCDLDLRSSMIQKGLQRARQFNWAATAKGMLSIMCE